MTREKAIEYLEWVRPKKPYTQDKKNVQTAIDMAIEALSDRTHGEWVEGVIGYHYCSECHNYALADDDLADDEEVLSDFCPCCGADMRKSGEEK